MIVAYHDFYVSSLQFPSLCVRPIAFFFVFTYSPITVKLIRPIQLLYIMCDILRIFLFADVHDEIFAIPKYVVIAAAAPGYACRLYMFVEKWLHSNRLMLVLHSMVICSNYVSYMHVSSDGIS